MRVELTGGGRDRDSVVLSPTPHLRIEEDATDMSALLFPKRLVGLVMRHGGFKAGWARQGVASEITLTPSTPDALFGELFEVLVGVTAEP